MMGDIFRWALRHSSILLRTREKIYDNNEIISVDSLLGGYSLHNLSQHFHSLSDLLSAKTAKAK